MDGIVVETSHGRMWINAADIVSIREDDNECVLLMANETEIRVMHPFDDMIDIIIKFNDDEDNDVNRLLHSIN